MAFEQASPGWQNEGVEPREEFKKTGFSAGYKPPAGTFNWFWTRVSSCLSEIQQKALDRTSLAQEAGASEDNAMSQKAATDSFIPKGKLAVTTLWSGVWGSGSITVPGFSRYPFLRFQLNTEILTQLYFNDSYLSELAFVGWVSGFRNDYNVPPASQRLFSHYVRNTAPNVLTMSLSAALTHQSSVGHAAISAVANITRIDGIAFY